MNTKKLLIAAVAILFSTTGFAQLPAKPKTFSEKITYKTVEKTDTTTAKKTRRSLTQQEDYDALESLVSRSKSSRSTSNRPGVIVGTSNGYAAFDKFYVKKGESFRMKYVFDPDQISVTGLSLDGKRMKRKDINFRKGIWETTITPQESHIYKLTVHYRLTIDSERTSTMPIAAIRVVVLDQDEYEKVDAKFEELRKNQDSDGYYKFKRELLNKHCGSISFKEMLNGM